MNDEISTDQPTILPPDAVALVWSKEDELHLLMPKENVKIPEQAMAIVGCFMRLSEDPDFLARMVKRVAAAKKA